MDGKKIFLILVLFMGISLANDAPGFFRDRTVPDKWSFLRRVKGISNQLERRKLPHKATGITFVDDEFTPFCNKKKTKVELEKISGNRKYKAEAWEEFCDPPDDSEMVDEDNVPHQTCNAVLRTYCFTKVENVEVLFEYVRRNRKYLKVMTEELRRGCQCGSQNSVRKR